MTPPAWVRWLQALQDPQHVHGWSLAEWQRVVRLARRLRLLGRLAEAIGGAGLEPSLPASVQQHLLSERRMSRYRLRVLTWTMERVGSLLLDAPYPVVLLKGAAYWAQGLPIAPGRLPSDLDLLVPRDALPDAQRRLSDDDWAEAELDAHDQHYYREWSHEVPPMRHPQFGIELDLHHAILPPVARTSVDTTLLLQRVIPTDLRPWRVLCPPDQVLHSAAHLFCDSELRDRVRDLVDLDGLLRHFAQRPGFWEDLVDRARELGLVEPLALTVHYTTRWLATPVPAAVKRRLKPLGPQPARQAWLLPLHDAVLTPTEPDAIPSRRQRMAATVLLARHHWRRMPLGLLLPHLWHKARRRHGSDGDDAF